ncbi:MAG: D-Ala-D-Ala carboxypeptidase family metallohydrolase [Pseudomonadota bacterium]
MTMLTMRVVSAAVLACLFFVATLPAHSVDKPDNPWHAITDFETDPDHGYLLRQSPFDTMDDVALAAVPRGNRIHYNAPSKCVPTKLKAVLKQVAAKYGPVTVNSTYRSPAKNRKIGGRKSSWHLKCAAVDFRVHASTKGLISYLRRHPNVGGYKRYKSGFYHIDTGPKRTW